MSNAHLPDGCSLLDVVPSPVCAALRRRRSGRGYSSCFLQRISYQSSALVFSLSSCEFHRRNSQRRWWRSWCLFQMVGAILLHSVHVWCINELAKRKALFATPCCWPCRKFLFSVSQSFLRPSLGRGGIYISHSCHTTAAVHPLIHCRLSRSFAEIRVPS